MTNAYFKRKFPDLPESYKVIFHALLSSSADEIVKACFDLFNLPIVLVDSDYQPISFYPKVKIGNEVWDTIAGGGRLPTKTIRDYQQAFLVQKGQHYAPFYSASGLVQDCPRIFAEVYDERQVYGHAAIFMFDNPPRDEDLQIVGVMVDALRFVLKKGGKGERQLFSDDLSCLLDERSELGKKEACSYSLSSRIKGDYVIMATPLEEKAYIHAFAAMDLSRAYPLLRYAVSCVHGNALVTLIGLMDKDEPIANRKAFFASLSKSLDLKDSKTGISPVFSNLNECRIRYIEALATASAAKEAVEFYEQSFPEPVFALLRERSDMSMVLPPELLRLLEDDGRDKTDYYKTLKTYLYCFLDQSEAAKQLSIHRNTLVYRLKRIEQKLSTDLADPKQCLKYLTAIQMLGK